MFKKLNKAIFSLRKIEISQDKLSTIFYSAFLFFWTIRFFNDLWLFQQLSPPVFYTGHDLSFQLLNSFDFVHAASQSFAISLIIDLCLVAAALFALIWKRKYWPNIAFSILLLSYIFLHYGALGAHKHNLSGLWFSSLIFMWKKDNSFAQAFKALRYFAIYAYASAGFWKIYRSCFNYDNFFSTILKSHNALFMYVHPESLKAKVVGFLLNHASLGDLLFQCMTIGELLFLIALFTTKFDKLLVYFAIGFHTVSYFLVNVYFYEFTLILIPLFFQVKPNKAKLFFKSVWKNSWSLGLICSFIVLAQTYYFISMIKLLRSQDFENTLFFGAYPIQNYMMYSYPYHADSFTDYMIYKGDELIVQQSWIPIKSEQFEGNIMEYEKIKANGGINEYYARAKEKFPIVFKNVNEEIDLENYKDWIFKKTARLSKADESTIKIYNCTFKFEGAQSILIDQKIIE